MILLGVCVLFLDTLFVVLFKLQIIKFLQQKSENMGVKSDSDEGGDSRRRRRDSPDSRRRRHDSSDDEAERHKRTRTTDDRGRERREERKQYDRRDRSRYR
jgi:hypothetical protein